MTKRIGKLGNKQNKPQVVNVCKLTAWKKEKDSYNVTQKIIKKVRKISKVKVITTTLPPASIAYLFWLSILTKNIKIEEINDNIDINSKLYSISQIATDGPHNKFDHNI